MLILLDKDEIARNLQNTAMRYPPNIEILDSVDSTNLYLKNKTSSTMLDICCAEQQTSGRGRFNRVWHSPFGSNIYFSGKWKLLTNIKKLSALSLVVGIATIDAIESLNITHELRIKWPNDLFYQNKKLGGILIEIASIESQAISVIIGIGINVNSSYKIDAQSNTISKPWCSLYDITATKFNRNLIVSKLIEYLDSYIYKFLKNGFNNFMNRWQELDYLYGKQISITNFNNQITGKADGINNIGELKLITNTGHIVLFNLGDTSIELNQ